MSDPNKKGSELLQRSSLYQEFLAEREEILRHKWLESEKRGRDIGFERALLDWIRNHREQWRAGRRPDGRPSSSEKKLDGEKVAESAPVDGKKVERSSRS